MSGLPHNRPPTTNANKKLLDNTILLPTRHDIGSFVIGYGYEGWVVANVSGFTEHQTNNYPYEVGEVLGGVDVHPVDSPRSVILCKSDRCPRNGNVEDETTVRLVRKHRECAIHKLLFCSIRKFE